MVKLQELGGREGTSGKKSRNETPPLNGKNCQLCGFRKKKVVQTRGGGDKDRDWKTIMGGASTSSQKRDTFM